MLGGVGIGFRRELATALLHHSPRVEHLELLLEASVRHAGARREAVAFARCFPVSIHGTQLSLGSAEGLELDRAQQLASLARETNALAVSEHISFTRSGGRSIGHLTALPFSREAAQTVARNATQLRRLLPDVPLYLENVAWGFRTPDDEMPEGAFHRLVCELSGCELLLDVANVYANAQNAGISAETLLSSYPLDRVGFIHVAGGERRGDFYFDTHAHALAPEVVALLALALRESGPKPVLLERDHDLSWSAVAPELAALREVCATSGSQQPPPAPGPTATATHAPRREEGSLADYQRITASALLDEPARTVGDAERALLSEAAIRRARHILEHKRLDEALAHLPRLRGWAPIGKLGSKCVAATTRTKRGAAAADARRIAEAATAHSESREAAQLDLLMLVANYQFDRHGARPRTLPWIGQISLERGRCVVVRGFGAFATPRILLPTKEPPDP